MNLYKCVWARKKSKESNGTRTVFLKLINIHLFNHWFILLSLLWLKIYLCRACNCQLEHVITVQLVQHKAYILALLSVPFARSLLVQCNETVSINWEHKPWEWLAFIKLKTQQNSNTQYIDSTSSMSSAAEFHVTQFFEWCIAVGLFVVMWCDAFGNHYLKYSDAAQ